MLATLGDLKLSIHDGNVEKAEGEHQARRQSLAVWEGADAEYEPAAEARERLASLTALPSD